MAELRTDRDLITNVANGMDLQHPATDAASAQSDLRQFYETNYARSSAVAPLIQDGNFLYAQTLRQIKPRLQPGLKVLDLGCNDGVLSLYMAVAGSDVLGIDLARNAVETAARGAAHYGITNARFMALDFQAQWMEPAAFDLVVCSHVIEHVPDDVGFLQRIQFALKPGGRLVLFTPSTYSSLVLAHKLFAGGRFKHDEEVGHLRRYSTNVLTQRIKAAGLVVDRIVPVDGFLREWVIVFEPMRWAKRIVGRRYVRSVYNGLDSLLAVAGLFPSALCVHAHREPDPGNAQQGSR